jgi:selenocysteine lyase/cysteine desulfurase
MTDDVGGLDERDWQRFRQQMPVARQWAYFDHAAVSPLPEAARQAMSDWAGDVAQNGDVNWPRWAERAEQTRRHAATLLGADPFEVALVRSTTEGINLVAEGFPWRPGDNVVTLADEFPSNLYPWMNLGDRGVETRRVSVQGGRVNLDDLAAACDRRTRIVAVSWVGYASGWRHDVDALAELAHTRGAYLFLDAIQGLGVFPLDVSKTHVDFLAADGHKWLLGPEGAGIFYLRHEHLDLLRPRGVGWNSVVAGTNFNQIELKFRPTAARYEGGAANFAGLAALGESLELLLSFGTAALAQRVLEITDLACNRLEQGGARLFTVRDDPNHSSGIVSFDWPGQDPMLVRKRCLDQGIVLSCRGGRLRISPHAYNQPADLDRLLAALEGG